MNLLPPGVGTQTSLSPVSYLRMSFLQTESKPATLKERVTALTLKLTESHLVSTLHLQKIQQFQERFVLIIPEENPEYAADLICFLICDVIHELQIGATSPQKIALQDFEKELKSYLQTLFHNEVDVEDYIITFFILTKEWEAMMEDLKFANELVLEIEKRIYQLANGCIQEILKRFELQKERILKINTERGFVFETVVGAREALTNHVDSGVTRLENLLNRQDNVDEKTLQARDELQTKLHRLEETLQSLEKIKR